MNILITGSTGFVGKNLITYLQNSGHKLRFLDRQALECLDDTAFEKGETVIHLAGKAHDVKKNADVEAYYKVNFELTKNLYELFLKSEAHKFIFISSVKASADVVYETLFEEDIPNPVTPYGKSKLMAEQFILSKSLPAEKVCYILRPCMIHGVGNKGNLNLLYRFVSKNLPYPLASFGNKRSFLSVKNLCFVIEELTSRSDIPSGIYNVADDEPLSTNEVVTILSESLDKSPLLWKIPKKIIQGLAKIGDLTHLPLTTERLNKLTENYIVSNKKLKAVLDKPLPLSSREGLVITARSFNKSRVSNTL